MEKKTRTTRTPKATGTSRPAKATEKSARKPRSGTTTAKNPRPPRAKSPRAATVTADVAPKVSAVFSGQVEAVLKALCDKKVEDLNILDVGDLVGYTDYFIIGTGTSFPHVQAMADAVAKILKVPGVKGVPIEGYQTGQWVLVDGRDFIVHLFQPDSRKFYALDDLWSDAPSLSYDPDGDVVRRRGL